MKAGFPGTMSAATGRSDQYVKVLDFATGVVDNQITYSRASSATYFDSSGVLQTAAVDEPRIHYLQDGSGYYGFYVEGSSTNICKYSDELSNAVWNKTVAEDITVEENIDSLMPGVNWSTVTVSNTSHSIWQILTVSAETTYTISFYAKRGTLTDCKYRVWDNSNSATIVALTSYYNEINSSNWTRVELTFTTPVGCAEIFFWPLRESGVTGTIYLGGFQIEQQSFATSYIPTTTASASRAADVASIDLTKVSWFNSSEGTLYIYVAMSSDENIQRIISIDNNSTTDRIELITIDNDSFQGTVRENSIGTCFATTPGSVDLTTVNEAAFGFKENNAASAINGSVTTTDTTVTMPNNLVKFRIGRDVQGLYPGFMVLSEIRYYSKRLTNAQLQAITS